MTDEEFRSQLLQKLDQMVFWLKMSNLDAARNHFLSILDSDQKKKAYHLSDGSATTREIGKLVGVDQKTIVNWWGDWIEKGIVEESQIYTGRKRKIVELTDLGL